VSGTNGATSSGATEPVVLESDGPEVTQSLAAALCGLCRAGDLVLLVGDLGAGKTTFAKGFGRALGIEEPITSPTFTLMRRYPVEGSGSPGQPRGIRALVHVDVYRLDTLGEIADLGLAEEIEDGGVALVEWGDVAVDALGTEWLSVRFEIVDDERRRITLLGTGPSWVARCPELAAAVAAAQPAAAQPAAAQLAAAQQADPLEEAAGP
jgi:tRNA threonylcarbamoyladenosine biosynthesis protein TsaE